MTIVSNRGPARRKRKLAQPVEIKAPRIVRTTRKGRAWRVEIQPETESQTKTDTGVSDRQSSDA